jgi:glycosyltransferase involved in cell wall biosynthesis
MRVAIVHDFLTQMGGAEKVVEVLHQMYPDAPIYTSMYHARVMPKAYRSWKVRTSFLQRLPFKSHSSRLALLLYPMAFESFDFSDYDVVISSSSAFAKGIVTQPHTAHICYTYTPMRYAWATRAYMNREKVSKTMRNFLVPGIHYLRYWDALAATRVDRYVAISTIVAHRIEKFYRRDCDIICPPVDTSRFSISPEVDDYYIIVSRFVPYKRIDLAVRAFTKLGIPLKVVGSGRQMKHLQEIAGPNIEFLGRVSDKELPTLMARAKAYVMPGEEDFGIAPVEANACGRPVIALAAGGALDTQIDGVTGVLFREQTVEGLCDAVRRLESLTFDPERIQQHAKKFDTSVFCAQIAKVVEDAYREKKEKFETSFPAFQGEPSA